MLYLKRKSDGKEFTVIKYTQKSWFTKTYITVWIRGMAGIELPSDEYELIFKP
jgi:hypothetical protein